MRRVLECMICGAFFLSSFKGFIDGDLNAFLGFLCAGLWCGIAILRDKK